MKEERGPNEDANKAAPKVGFPGVARSSEPQRTPDADAGSKVDTDRVPVDFRRGYGQVSNVQALLEAISDMQAASGGQAASGSANHGDTASAAAESEGEAK